MASDARPRSDSPRRRAGGRTGRRAFADLHTHSRASFDSLASPASLVRTAASRGLTHLAITDHDRIDGALEARAIAADDRARPHGDRRRGDPDAPTAT